MVVYVVVILIGIFGNLLVFVVVWKIKMMYMMMNYLFVNLVVSDIFVLLWCLSMYNFVVVGFFFEGELGDYLCRFFIGDFMDIFCLGVMIFMFIVLVVECY